MIEIKINYPPNKDNIMKEIIDFKVKKIINECSKKEIEEIINILEKQEYIHKK